MVAETLKLSEVLRDFGPKEQKIWDNTMLHPSITNVISALVDQVRSQNETINELMSKNSDSPPTRHVHAEENGGASVQEKVRDIEDRLVARSSSEEDKNGRDIEASVSFSAVHDRIFERLENLEPTCRTWWTSPCSMSTSRNEARVEEVPREPSQHLFH